jgi:hypothetical protein
MEKKKFFYQVSTRALPHHHVEEVGALPTPHLKMLFDHRMLLHAPLKRHECIYLLAHANNFFFLLILLKKQNI